MRLATVYPQEPPRADWSDIAAVQQRLIEASEELDGLVDAVAKAMTVREFSSDRRKRSLALAVRGHLVTESAAAAETLGRASIAYGEALDAQEKQLESAERVIAQRDAVRASWESARSCLSSLKATIANV